MTIMMAVNGQQIWTEQEGEEISPSELFDILIDDGVDDKTAYIAIGNALVHGNSDVTVDGCVLSISIG